MTSLLNKRFHLLLFFTNEPDIGLVLGTTQKNAEAAASTKVPNPKVFMHYSECPSKNKTKLIAKTYNAQNLFTVFSVTVLFQTTFSVPYGVHVLNKNTSLMKM
jgi:predicted porin